MTGNLPRVYPIIDTATLASRGIAFVQAAAGLLEGGARILQFRHKSFWTREIFAQAEEIAGLCRSASATFIVNDRADYAMVLGAGVHVGQDDLLPSDARRVAGDAAMIGFSTHNPAQMRDAQSEPADYLAFGPVFPTASKDRPDPLVGVEGLRAVRALSEKPLVAIGGITLENASLCRNAGADSVAVIAGLLRNHCSERAIRERMAEWMRLE